MNPPAGKPAFLLTPGMYPREHRSGGEFTAYYVRPCADEVNVTPEIYRRLKGGECVPVFTTKTRSGRDKFVPVPEGVPFRLLGFPGKSFLDKTEGGVILRGGYFFKSDGREVFAGPVGVLSIAQFKKLGDVDVPVWEKMTMWTNRRKRLCSRLPKREAVPFPPHVAVIVTAVREARAVVKKAEKEVSEVNSRKKYREFIRVRYPPVPFSTDVVWRPFSKTVERDFSVTRDAYHFVSSDWEDPDVTWCKDVGTESFVPATPEERAIIADYPEYKSAKAAVEKYDRELVPLKARYDAAVVELKRVTDAFHDTFDFTAAKAAWEDSTSSDPESRRLASYVTKYVTSMRWFADLDISRKVSVLAHLSGEEVCEDDFHWNNYTDEVYDAVGWKFEVV